MGEKSAPTTNIKNEEKKRTVFIPNLGSKRRIYSCEEGRAC